MAEVVYQIPSSWGSLSKLRSGFPATSGDLVAVQAPSRLAPYWQPFTPFVRQIEEPGGGGIVMPRSLISAISSFSASGCATADCTPTRTKPRDQSRGIHVSPFIAPAKVSRLPLSWASRLAP